MYQGNSLQIQSGKPPIPLKKDERITKAMLKEHKKPKKQNPIIEAMKYQEYLESPYIDTYSQVAQYFGVSRARVCQMLNLLKLDNDIKQYLLSIKDNKLLNFFTERRLRPLPKIKNKNEQKQFFKNFIYP